MVNAQSHYRVTGLSDPFTIEHPFHARPFEGRPLSELIATEEGQAMSVTRAYRKGSSWMAPQQYLIYSHEHQAWWKAGRWGYTEELAQAGAYSKREAWGICERANFPFFSHHDQGHGDLPAEVMIEWTDCEEQAWMSVQAATGSLIAARMTQ